ncbi:hypothetical protein DSLPV1_099 [Dishui lake phycodnavirus 1]|uniref:hypothetical protein n=1 Tax=Dishui lake phycodnavirus 1 TaxID=2079134 RepID=UPI000CD68DBB|nr:hypothetical protein C5Y57_gp099 [Dishui lake phycodnavirus 1]AUT19070.1 hypothetical protein DSLPV1_099 [Dishui lake phycodnavirus 1]
MDRYTRYVLQEAKFHMKRAEEILTEGLADPEKFYVENNKEWRDILRVFPFLVLAVNARRQEEECAKSV